ncbi:MAG: helix-turn-helix domain-containing protein [Halopseudomonas sp.]|uniref:AraC family transcriptional regulator n=1 Tax=Halopseudomonas sp. TaxID=2901191 RepID=UPI0030029CB6
MTPPPLASHNNLAKILKGLRPLIAAQQLEHALGTHRLDHLPARSRVPLARVNAMLEDLVRQQQDPLLLINAFSHLDYSPALLRKSYMAGASTLGDAINLAARYTAIDSEVASVQLEVQQANAYLLLSGNPRAPSRLQLDAVLYSMARLLRSLGLRSALQVELPPLPDATLAPAYCQAFDAPLVFSGQAHRLSFPAIELARVLDWSGDAIDKTAKRERQLIRLQPYHSWSGSVSTLVAIGLRRGEFSLACCARWLAVSSRTLQRRLQAEQKDFTDLVDSCRQRLSLEYLQAGYSNDSIALLLGYRQTAQYFRSFRRWHGVSPSAYVRRAAAARLSQQFMQDIDRG